jgi:abortive infection bacteriophage resistance protein
LYVFDRKLRLLTLDAIEKIEISLKANINDYITKEFGCFWYKNEELFNLNYKDNLKIYNEILGKTIPEINQRKTIFIKHYFEKYEEECLPSWMLFEELTF